LAGNRHELLDAIRSLPYNSGGRDRDAYAVRRGVCARPVAPYRKAPLPKPAKALDIWRRGVYKMVRLSVGYADQRFHKLEFGAKFRFCLARSEVHFWVPEEFHGAATDLLALSGHTLVAWETVM